MVEHAFRHNYGRIVAVLARRVGVQHIERVEDAVQAALMAALSAWTQTSLPADPAAWLYRVAHNHLLQELRQQAGRAELLAEAATDAVVATEMEASEFADAIHDDLLRMLFVCCDVSIPWESQIVVALKTLCGFSTKEIAQRLFISEANVLKRLSRAREQLRALGTALPDDSTWAKFQRRVAGVQAVLYLLFNEGYLSTEGEPVIRVELCDEAIRLATLLAEHPVGASPETYALLALMHLHVARLGSRRDAMGGLLLLEEQDRDLWDRERMQTGFRWLEKASAGNRFSRYHAEAGIAAEHCLAPTFAATRWQEIVDLYEMLEAIAPSPLHRLNRAVAMAEWQGPQAALEILQGLVPSTWLSASYLWDAVLADLHRRSGNLEVAAVHGQRALKSAPNEAVRALLARRLVEAAQ